MQHILSKFEVKKTTILIVFLTLLSGLFKPLIIIGLILFIHEMGHLGWAFYFKFKISKIIIYPFGVMIKFNDLINRDINEEFLVATGGIMAQLIMLFINGVLFKFSIISADLWQMIYNYNITLIIFNLIPIYPLDGSKILNLTFEKWLSFKMCYIIKMLLSLMGIICMIVFCLIIHFNLSYMMIIMVLVSEWFTLYKEYNYTINKFFLERFLYKLPFSKTYIINGDKMNKMRKGYKHLFLINGIYYTERDMLHKRFDLNYKI